MSLPVVSIRMAALVLALAVTALLVIGFNLYSDASIQTCVDQLNGRRGRLVQRYLCSPQFLAGDWRGWFAFVWLWSFPLALAAAAIPLARRRTAAPHHL